MAHSLFNAICLCAITLSCNTNMDVELRTMINIKKGEFDG